MSQERLPAALPITHNASHITQTWEGAGSRVNHEPEDLPGELTIVPSWAGELARMSCGSNPQGLSGLGDFLFEHSKPSLYPLGRGCLALRGLCYRGME